MIIHGRDYTDATPPQDAYPLCINSSGQVALQQISGEANPTSSTASYLRTHRKCNLAVISKTTAVTIGGGAASDTMLIGLFMHTALTGTAAITGFADSDGTAQTYTIPAGYVGFVDFFGAVNSAGALTITCSNAGDDNKVAVFWFAV